jgi:hypothetical protein
MGSTEAGEPHGIPAGAARGAGDQDAPAQEWARTVQGPQGTGSGDGDRADHSRIGSGRDRADPGGVHGTEFRPRAVDAERDHRGAGRRAGPVSGGPHHHPGRVPAEDGAVGRFLQAEPDFTVVEGSRRHPNQSLMRGRFGIGYLPEAQSGRRGAVNEQSTHEGVPFARDQEP